MDPKQLRANGRNAAPAHWNTEENRLGRLLLKFRKRNGWAGQTAEDWAKTCPDLWPVRIANSVWTNLETGKAKIPSLSTFEALGIMNELLDGHDRGHIPQLILRSRVYDAEPIRGDDGKVWSRHDFFDLYINKLQIPAAYDSPPVSKDMTQADAADASEVIRESFRQFLGDSGMGPIAAVGRIIGSIGPLSGADRATAEEALLGLTTLSPAHQKLIAALLDALKEHEHQAV